MSKPILCVGALTLDTIFRLEELPRAAGKVLPLEAVTVAEGMAAAQAASIVRLGGTAALWASRGADTTGKALVRQIAAAGVDCGAVRVVSGARSGFSTILMDRVGHTIIVPQYDAALRARPDTVPDFGQFAAVMCDVRWPAAAEVALHASQTLGIPGILDADVAPADVLERLFPVASHVIASEHAAALLGAGSDPAAATQRLARRHPGLIVVTAGREGCFWFDRAAESVRNVPATPVDAIDTLAAGDVFHAGFAVGLVEGWATERSLRFASVAAAIKCTRFGGRLGCPTRDEVEAFAG